MRGSDIVRMLPEKDYRQREQLLLSLIPQQVSMGIEHMTRILSVAEDLAAAWIVFTDTLKLGVPGDEVRISASHWLAQQIAYRMGCVLPTAKLSDEIYRQADLKLPPLPQEDWVKDETMGYTSRMVQFSRMIDKQIGDRPALIIAGHHKDWINTARLGTTIGKAPPPSAASSHGGKMIGAAGLPAGVNYGWHCKGGRYPSQTLPGVTVLQPVGMAHDIYHVDYSQQVRLIADRVRVFVPDDVFVSGVLERHQALLGSDAAPDEINGFECETPCGKPGRMYTLTPQDVADLPELRPLASGEGKARFFFRHPAIEPTPPAVAGWPPHAFAGVGLGDSSGNEEVVRWARAQYLKFFAGMAQRGTEEPPRLDTASVAGRVAAMAAGAVVGAYGFRWLERMVRQY